LKLCALRKVEADKNIIAEKINLTINEILVIGD